MLGMYFCNIEPINKMSMSETSILEGHLAVSVNLFSMDHSSSLSQQHLLTFLPAFYVQQQEIVLSDLQLSAQVVISASSSVQHCIVVKKKRICANNLCYNVTLDCLFIP